MKIEWTLDEEEGIDPTDPVGNLILSDGKTTIQLESTYLDSWFEAFITGIKEITAGNSTTVEIAEEPDLLMFKYSKSGIIISYQNQDIFVKNTDELLLVLRESAKKFIEKLDKVKIVESNNLLIVIRDF
ncbi:MAG: hypothetical protein F6K47_28095 [Symploca sp. SIO2E6]|nr:hypothetical protein [Symploca sp. SIO2E6]